MITAAALLLILTTGDFPSGPAVGEKLPDFKAQQHLGPDAGKEFKLHDKTKGGPTLLIFMHAPGDAAITRPGFQFLKPVDKYAAEQPKLATHIVWVTGNKDNIEKFLTRAEKSLDLKSPVSICLDGGKDGPETYGLNDKVQITVLVAKDNKVIANFALTDPNAKDSAKVIAAVAKVLGTDSPKEQPEEKKKVRPGKDEKKLARDGAALQGTWKVTSMVKRGEVKDVDYFRGTLFVFSEQELRISTGGDNRAFAIKIDPAKKLKELDLTVQAGDFKGKRIPCIYQFVGESLVICTPHDKNEERPDAFETFDRPPSRILYTLERVKER